MFGDLDIFVPQSRCIQLPLPSQVQICMCPLAVMTTEAQLIFPVEEDFDKNKT